jgi:phospholipid/cholesterol/gamma-HCH transport system permease protein
MGLPVAITTAVGGWTILTVKTILALFPPRIDLDELKNELYKTGIKSLPVLVSTSAFVGALMVIQTGGYVKSTGATSLVGLTASVSIFSQIGPVLLGLMFSGRVGANNTAELGTMAVTEQIDAMRMLAIDPIRLLVLPRFLSMLFVMFLLAAVGDLVALFFGALTAQALLGINMRIFYLGVVGHNHLTDFLLGVVKSVMFGGSISIVSCYYGLNVKGGTTGVGRAVNDSVVASAIAIFVIDFVVTVLWL